MSSMEPHSPIGMRIYRPSKRSRTFIAVSGGFVFIAGIWVLATLVPSQIAQLRNDPRPAALLYCCLSAAIGGFMVLQGIALFRSYWKRVLILTADAVMVEFLYGLRALKFTQILGCRAQHTRYGRQTVIVPNARPLRKLVIKEGYIVDDFYRDWLASLADLDAADKKRRRAEGKLHFWES